MSWTSLPFVEMNGQDWPISFAAQLLDVPEKDLRRGVKKQGIEPSGIIRVDGFRRSGRHPMAYPSAKLISIAEEIKDRQEDKEEELFPGSA